MVRKQEMDCQLCAWRDQWKCDVLLPSRGANGDGGNSDTLHNCLCFAVIIEDCVFCLWLFLHVFDGWWCIYDGWFASLCAHLAVIQQSFFLFVLIFINTHVILFVFVYILHFA